MPRFILDWIAGESRATRFLPRSSTGRRGRRPSTELVKALVESNRRWGLFAEELLQRWAGGQTTTLVAGQQVGFAGGPLHTLAKLATLVRMKRELERAGTPATAFFWLATEDHDYDEVAQLSVPVSTISTEKAVNRQVDLLCIRAARATESRRMVGPQPIPEALTAELLNLYDLPRPQWLREGITFGDSFAELVATLFGREIVLIDSLLPELRRAGASLFEAMFGRWAEVQRAVASRSRELETNGYLPQVTSRHGEPHTLLFAIGEHGEREVIDAPRKLPPERISTSALTRPLLQDFVLAPDVFIGGPAEVSYYAQIVPLHELLGVAMPRVALRGHALIAPKRVVRFISRFEIEPRQIFTQPEQLLAEREPETVSEVERTAATAQKELMQHVQRIADIALPADHALARAISRSIGHLEYHFNKLTERAIKSLVRKNRERYEAARELVATLYPDGHVQDRIVGWFPYWVRHEQHLVERMIDEIEPDTGSFKVISL